MEKSEFKQLMIEYLNKINISLSDFQLEQFYLYMNVLIEWNKVMNLTGITEPNEIITKHFIDSLTVLNKIDEKGKIIDVGTGARISWNTNKDSMPRDGDCISRFFE